METNSNLYYTRLFELNQKVQVGSATKQERDEYMLLLFRNNSISKKQYDEYISGKSNQELFDAAITIGGIVLLGYMLGKLFSK